MRRPRRVVAAATMVAAVLLGAACSTIRPSTYTVRADFSRTVGLFPGSFVRELGITIGTVTKVVNQGDHVNVTMKVDTKYALRPDVTAILVGNSVLGERYVQFTPAYLGGPRLPDGALVPIQRTAVPVETDEVLRSLQRVLGQIDPHNASAVVTNFAQLVAGQGAKINELLANSAGTLSIIADKSNDLAQMVDSLATLTGTLRTRDETISALVRDYDTVSGVLAGDQRSVDGTITELSNATTQAAALLGPNLSGIEDDVSVLTTTGQTLDRNLDSLDRGLANAGPRLFTAAKRAYDAQHNWLPLNPQNNSTASSEVVAARVRDSLSSLCRRLAVREPAMAPALASCGDPNSGFFDPILNLVPKVLSQLPGQSSPGHTQPTPTAAASSVTAASVPAASSVTATSADPTSADPAPASAVSAFLAGLSAIPGLSGAQRSALTAATSGALPSTPAALAMATTAADPNGLPPLPTLVDAPRAPHGLWGHVRGFFSRVFGDLL